MLSPSTGLKNYSFNHSAAIIEKNSRKLLLHTAQANSARQSLVVIPPHSHTACLALVHIVLQQSLQSKLLRSEFRGELKIQPIYIRITIGVR